MHTHSHTLFCVESSPGCNENRTRSIIIIIHIAAMQPEECPDIGRTFHFWPMIRLESMMLVVVVVVRFGGQSVSQTDHSDSCPSYAINSFHLLHGLLGLATPLPTLALNHHHHHSFIPNSSHHQHSMKTKNRE